MHGYIHVNSMNIMNHKLDLIFDRLCIDKYYDNCTQERR